MNEAFGSNPKFIQRNMTVSPEEHLIKNYKSKVPQGSMRFIASKEALDNWHAQSLGVNLDKYLKKQKEYQNEQKSNKYNQRNE